MQNHIRIKPIDTFSSDISSLLLQGKNYIPHYNKNNSYYAMYRDSVLIGIAATWENPIHPYHRYISMFILPEERGKGYGAQLSRNVIRLEGHALWQTAFDSDNIDAEELSKSLGFIKARCCFEYAVKKEDFIGSKGEANDINSLSSPSINIDTLIAMVKKDYEDKHLKINPLSKSLSYASFKNIVLDGVDYSNSYVCLMDGHIISYSLCYEEDEDSISIGYVGNRGKDHIYSAFLCNVVTRLFSSFQNIWLEMDDCDKDAMVLKSLFKYNSEASWDTYVLNV